MDRPRWELLQAMIDRVAGASAEERDALIVEACGGDAELIRELRQLLAAMDDDDFLETPAAESLVESDVQPASLRAIGQRVGPFVIRGLLGHGGMGAVYRAVRADADFEQTVAMKLVHVPGGIAPHSAMAARFERERRTLARLEHPGIARFIDGGLADDGTPYIAMELVEGEPIDRFASRLELHQRLRLFVDVCDAVQYAHANFVVHRDLKPDNILVTASGRAVLLDFGIAKLLAADDADAENSGLTRSYAPLTLQYASPEQIAGDPVTASTDVYGLGLVLCEMLTNERPYRVPPRSLAGAAEAIRSLSPTRPSVLVASGESREAKRLAAALRGDLDTIVLRAIDKDPGRRYRSVAEFAEDVRRYLQSLPIRARPDTRLYRLRKFAVRNRTPVIAIALVLGSLSAALIVSLLALAEVRDANQREREQRLATGEINRFLVGMFEAVDPSQTKAQDAAVLRALLDRGADRLDAELGSRPVAAAQLRATIGTTYRLIGELDDARRLLRRNLDERVEMLGAEHPDTLTSAQQLGLALLAAGELEEAQSLLADTLETQRQVLGDEHADTLRTMNDLGEALRHRGDLDAAEALLRESLDGRERLLGSEHRETLVTMNNVAGVLAFQNRFDEALPVAERVYELQRDVLGEDHLDTLVTASDLGMIHQNIGDADTAADFGRTAYEGLIRVLGPGHLDTLIVGTNLGGQLRDLKRSGEALDLFTELEAVAREALPRNHYLLPWLTGSRAMCLFDFKRFEEAEPLFLASYEGLAASVGESNRFTQAAAGRLAVFYGEWGKADEAAAWRERAGAQ
jgi:serine/threonine-protein kinase